MGTKDRAILVYLTPEPALTDPDNLGMLEIVTSTLATGLFGGKVPSTRRRQFITVTIRVQERCGVDTASFDVANSAKCCVVDEAFNAASEALAAEVGLPVEHGLQAICGGPTVEGETSPFKSCQSCRQNSLPSNDQPNAEPSKPYLVPVRTTVLSLIGLGVAASLFHRPNRGSLTNELWLSFLGGFLPSFSFS